MNSHQLLQLAFLGVFASDMLPVNIPTPSALIANLDSSEEAGSHWVTLYFLSRGIPEYMDSFGLPPKKSFLKLLGSKYRCNTVFLQSPFSAVCGQYCLYFIKRRNLLSSMNTVLSVFTEGEHFFNDGMVNSYVQDHFSVQLKMFDINWELRQLSRTYV